MIFDVIKMAFSVILGLLVCFSFFQSDAFDQKLRDAHQDAYTSFVNMQLLCQIPEDDLQTLGQIGVTSCLIQDYKNVLDATLAVQGINTASNLKKILMLKDIDDIGNVDICARTYVLANEKCPELFMSMSPRSKILLSAKASMQ